MPKELFDMFLTSLEKGCAPKRTKGRTKKIGAAKQDTMKLELNKAELMAVWDALQQLIDNTDEGADAEPRELATRQAAEAVVARIEERLVPAMKAGGKLPDI